MNLELGTLGFQVRDCSFTKTISFPVWGGGLWRFEVHLWAREWRPWTNFFFLCILVRCHCITNYSKTWCFKTKMVFSISHDAVGWLGESLDFAWAYLCGGWAPPGQLGHLDLFLSTWSFLLKEGNPCSAASQGGGSMLTPNAQVLSELLLTFLMFHWLNQVTCSSPK